MEHHSKWMQKISMHDFVEVGNEVYFFALNFNGLYRMQLPERKLEFLGCAPGENVYQKHIYGAIAQAGGKLYLPPRNGKEIAVFDIKEGVFEKIPLKYDATGLPFKFVGALAVGTKVYLIPGRYRYLVIVDTKTGTVEYRDDFLLKLDVPDTYGGLLMARSGVVKGESLYMAAMADNVLVKLSLTGKETELIRIGEDRNGFSDLCLDKDGETLWFVQKGRPAVLEWKEKLGECIVYDTMPAGFTHGDTPFFGVLDEGSKVTAIGYHANMSIEIDKVHHTIRQAKWDVAGTEGAFNDWHAKHYFAKKTADETFLVANIDDHSFDLVENGSIKEHFWLQDGQSEVALLYWQKQVLRENDVCGLQEFINYVRERK